MGPPGMPSLGGMLPITGLGAAAALWRTEEEEDRRLATEVKQYGRRTADKKTDGNTIVEWYRQIICRRLSIFFFSCREGVCLGRNIKSSESALCQARRCVRSAANTAELNGGNIIGKNFSRSTSLTLTMKFFFFFLSLLF